ncbi:hypothetical protein SUGI_0559090 [Cryptomeria japonica]|nr:hypothetical protein SUGI_0559090 [Cryptomeria japonica]
MTGFCQLRSLFSIVLPWLLFSSYFASAKTFSYGDFNESILKEEVYVGFTASTGTYAIEGHYILGWSFSTEGKAPPLDLSDLPSFIKKKPITRSRGFTADEEVTADQLGSVPVSVESATTSTSHGYDKDSDYDIGR